MEPEPRAVPSSAFHRQPVRTEIAAHDANTLYLHLDLPEIEDVVPETRKRVLKGGRTRDVKRKKAERCEAYANLAAGIALMMASGVFASSPTLNVVKVAAYTQRKQRRSEQIGDDYIYDVEIPRGEIHNLDPTTVDPVALLSRLPGRIEPKSDLDLKKLKAPSWVALFRASPT